ncbi:MAG: PAS domain S-box protein [Desulfobacterales bacterium]|nr:MAG: PAS domain S-box protein [Desulfobacterales bacterium]
MSDQQPLYNSRITRTYLQYLRKNYPDITIDALLEKAGIANYEIEDPGHWFTQEQVDRFHETLIIETGDADIARKAGRFAGSSEGVEGAAKQMVMGLMSPTATYLLVEKLYAIMSRGAIVRAKKLGPDKVEIVSMPKTGVAEKAYQCQNRTGFFESLAKWFTDKYATVEHPECFHRGDEFCRYIVAWEKTPALIWKRIRNYLMLGAVLAFLVLLPLVSLKTWGIIFLLSTFFLGILSQYASHLENQELTRTIETQKAAAEENLVESNIRYNNALLIQEIGQVASKILAVDELMRNVASVMEKRLDFDRGMIMLADRDRARLNYMAGYGHTKEQEEFLKQTAFNLDNPESRGLFVLAMRERKPFLIDNINEIENTLSEKSLTFAKRMGSRSLICVPIIYEKESLGILAVDNSKSKMPLKQSDMSLLMGVASQLAISITNAMSFKKLQQSETKYRELIETANSIILRMDAEANITFSNEFAQRFLGYTEEEMLGRNAARIIFQDSVSTQQGFNQLINSMRRNPEISVVSENETSRRNGEKVWIAWAYKPIFDDEGKFREILCIGNDITELRRADREKKDLQAQLQRAQKMEAIGTLAGGVAHDLNNILSGIVSYPDLLLIDLPQESPLCKPILTIQKSGEKAAAIVQDLLTLARRGVAATEVVNLNSIIMEYLLSPEHAKLELNHPNVKLERHLDPNLLNILGSPVHLSKTIMNLISNAAEAMPDGGKIVITTENRHEDIPKNGFDEIDAGDYATVIIKDTGIGISQEDLERIFEPFYTKKSMGRSGTGLGMAVVWGTVKDHRGFIDIKSKEGKGTTITLYIPVTRQAFTKEVDLVSLESLKGHGESILIVDDVKEQREIASEILEKLGYTVNTVSSGEEAVSYLHESSADLMVLDMIMDPGIDGLETYQKVLEIKPSQKAIIASGYSESIRVKEAQRLGAGAYVKKPYLLEKFGRAVRAELDKS